MEPNNQAPITEPVTQKSFISRHEWLAVVSVVLLLALLGALIWWPMLRVDKVQGINHREDTSGWKTYKNEKYGISFSYPPDLFVQVRDTDTVAQEDYPDSATLGPSLYLNLMKENGYSSYDSFLSITVNTSCDWASSMGVNCDMTKNPELRDGLYDVGETVVDGKRAIRVLSCNAGCSLGIFLKHGDSLVDIGVSADDTEFKDGRPVLVENKIAEAIIGSLEFTATTTLDVSTWKTYRNEEYGFEFKYPEEGVTPDTPIMTGNMIILEIGMGNGISIFPKGEHDYGYDDQPIISDVKIGGLKAKKQFWENNQIINYNIIDPAKNWISCEKDLKNCNRISVVWETGAQLELLNQILSTFKFTN